VVVGAGTVVVEPEWMASRRWTAESANGALCECPPPVVLHAARPEASATTTATVTMREMESGDGRLRRRARWCPDCRGGIEGAPGSPPEKRLISRPMVEREVGSIAGV